MLTIVVSTTAMKEARHNNTSAKYLRSALLLSLIISRRSSSCRSQATCATLSIHFPGVGILQTINRIHWCRTKPKEAIRMSQHIPEGVVPEEIKVVNEFLN